jgi:hypothetical protein
MRAGGALTLSCSIVEYFVSNAFTPFHYGVVELTVGAYTVICGCIKSGTLWAHTIAGRRGTHKRCDALDIARTFTLITILGDSVALIT